MKKILAVLLAAAMTLLCIPTIDTGAENTSYTPEEYVAMMVTDQTFDLKAYMFYNEDLMSAYTYEYWKYYKHYLEKGISQGRQALFNEGEAFKDPVLGVYSTHYKSGTNRGDNIELACSFLNNAIILPGGEFSYNNTVGVRSSARGFKSAPIFVSGEKSMGIGGGICQVSSTTYVAMMIAGIPATERHVHSLPVSYLKKNLDATVSYGKLDLKFINPYDFPIIINTACDGNGTLTVAISRYIFTTSPG